MSTPGLIDSHVHVGLVHDLAQDINFYSRELVEQQLRIYAAYGVTAVQVLGTDTDVIFGIRADQRKAPSDMARVYTSGQGLVFKGSYGGVAGLNKPVANVAEARHAVDEQVAKGVDFIKLWVDDEFGDVPSRMPPTSARPSSIRRTSMAARHRSYLLSRERQDIGGAGRRWFRAQCA